MISTQRVDLPDACLRCVGPEDMQLLPSPDGPLLVRGARHVVDGNDQVYPVQRPVVALCRCGTSKLQPWCDGMHKLVKNRDRNG